MPLVVYKSSAGSGKTATLVLEYLRLCLSDPREFKRTLAITFTNKAANEMKSRIISSLEMGASGETNFLLTQLKKDLDFNDLKLISACRELLSLIIHNYDEFAVSTIDSFVHRIIRTFANEVNLPANFEVILDSDDIVPEIVDELFEKVGSDAELTNIMLSFVMKQIEEEKSHDLSSILSDFVAYNLSEDVFKQKEFLNTLKLSDFPSIIKRLLKKQKNSKSEIENLAKKAIDLFDSVSLVADDLSNKKRGIYGYFFNLLSLKDDAKLSPNSYAVKAVENDKWVAAKANASIKMSVDEIKEELISIFNLINKTAPSYLLLKLINSKIYSIALTTEIQKLFSEFVERTGNVHVSEFNKKISESIAGQPVPFLYERLGFKYKNFLIDEFQDTSILQWNNLLPLVEESLSNQNFNMLVGDAKQAIYRFRNGEVELFTSLPKMYANDDSPFRSSREQLFTDQFVEKFLDSNYRSNKHIVEFNNDFFNFLFGKESERFKRNYSNLEQKVQNSNDGFVSLNLLEAKNVSEFSEKRLPVIIDFVEDVLMAGFNAGDICILCRTKKQIAEIAEFLINNKYKIVSSESLLVANSPKVSIIVSFLRLLLKPDEKLLLADFVFKYSGFKNIDEAEEVFFKLADSENSFPELALELMGASNESVENLLALSVYEICEFLVRKMHFNENADIFIQYFLDFVHRTQLSGKFTLNDFIAVWNEKSNKVFVELPEDKNAIKIMTAHKSKGLDFKIVIADLYYSKSNKSKDFWTNINIEGEDLLTKTILPLNKSIAQIELEDIYLEEQDKERLDFLNLVYVAFTRASIALYAIGSTISRDGFGSLLNDYMQIKGNTDQNESHYEYGTLMLPIEKENQKPSEEKVVTDFHINRLISTDWHSLISIAEAEDIYWEENDFNKPSSFGKLVHKILSEINFVGDVEKAVAKYRLSGLINESEENKIKQIILSVVNNSKLKRFYSDGVLVKNETELYDKNGKIIRPDRVVLDNETIVIIDYKTGKREKKHEFQIRNYADVFGSLGYENVLSFLVYLGNEIVVDQLENTLF
jgi:ATP-dependent exoDNAse (exonuclease V) beta subunit